VDVIALKDAAGEVGLICVAAPKPLDRRLLIPEGFEELERKLFRIERLLRQL